MELQQNLNLLTLFFKQTLGIQAICRDDYILNIRGKQYIQFYNFWRYDNIALSQRFIVVVFTLLSKKSYFFNTICQISHKV